MFTNLANEQGGPSCTRPHPSDLYPDPDLHQGTSVPWELVGQATSVTGETTENNAKNPGKITKSQFFPDKFPVEHSC